MELMSDSIGSYNEGMPGGGVLVPDDDPSTIGAPHDLTPSERVRFATEVISGVRTIRLTGGEPLVRRDVVDPIRAIGRMDRPMSPFP